MISDLLPDPKILFVLFFLPFLSPICFLYFSFLEINVGDLVSYFFRALNNLILTKKYLRFQNLNPKCNF
jgi:hypothetical protein